MTGGVSAAPDSASSAGGDAITLETLTRRHPDRVRWEGKWSDYRLLYRGGDDMLRSCGQLVNTRITSTLQTQITNALTPQAMSGMRNRRFLWQLEGEPDPSYYQLWNRAYYINYYSAIIDYHRHWLFSEDPIIRPRDGDDHPDWWRDFYENANGSGKGFCDFVRDSFLDVLVARRGGWLIGRNTSVGSEGDDDSVILTPYPAEQIYDWERDSAGELLWVVLGTREMYREFPGERMLVSTYTYVDRSQWKTWQVQRGDQYRKNGGPNQKKDAATGGTEFVNDGYYEDDSLQVIGEGVHGLGKVPFVMLEIPEGLWIGDKLAAPCVDIFNKQNRLTNAQLYGCIVQAYLKTSDATKSSVTFGETQLVRIRPADAAGGGEEDFGWKSPDVGPLEFISRLIAEQRDEIYRIVHQMALAVDSKAIGAIARSGASKIEDRKASEIILAAYGGYVAESMLRTVTLLGEIYGDNTVFTLDGYKDFNVSSLDEEVQVAALALSMGLKSKTAKQEIELRAIGRILDFVDETTKDTIEQETRDAYEQEEEAKMAPPAIPHIVGEDGKPTPAVGAPIGDAGKKVADAYKNVAPPKTLGDKDKE